MFSMLDQLGGVEGSVPSYPPYNIERTGENAYRISVAVAGFTDGDRSFRARRPVALHASSSADSGLLNVRA